jgi:hypothetical protein
MYFGDVAFRGMKANFVYNLTQALAALLIVAGLIFLYERLTLRRRTQRSNIVDKGLDFAYLLSCLIMFAGLAGTYVFPFPYESDTWIYLQVMSILGEAGVLSLITLMLLTEFVRMLLSVKSRPNQVIDVNAVSDGAKRPDQRFPERWWEFLLGIALLSAVFVIVWLIEGIYW